MNIISASELKQQAIEIGQYTPRVRILLGLLRLQELAAALQARQGVWLDAQIEVAQAAAWRPRMPGDALMPLYLRLVGTGRIYGTLVVGFATAALAALGRYALGVRHA